MSPTPSPWSRSVRAVGEALWSDRLLQSVLVLHLVGLAFVQPWRAGVGWVSDAAAFWEVLQFACFFLAVGSGLRRLTEARERLFWSYLAAGFGFWLVANLLRWWVPRDGGGDLVDIAVDSLYLAYYLSFIFAVDSRPDLGRRTPAGDRDRQLNLWGAVLFAFALLIYFVHIPSNLDFAEYRAGWLSLALYIGLDFFLVLRLIYLGIRTRSPRWAVLYRLLLVSFVGFLAVDGADYLSRLPGSRIPSHYGTPWDVLWIAPFLLMILAVRVRHGSIDGTVKVEEGWRREPLGPLVLYAITFPLMHLLLHYFGAGSPASHRARDLLTISYFVVLGGMAVWQFRHRDETRRQAQQQLRESEDNYRQLVQSSSNVIVVEQRGIVVYANTLACEMLGIDRLPTQLSLTDLGLPSPPSEPSRSGPTTASLPGEGASEPDLGGGAQGSENQVVPWRLQTGETEYRLLVAYHPVVLSQCPAWQMIARDVTRLGALRRQHRRLARLATLGELAATFSDEIRQPMATLEEGCRGLDRRGLDAEGEATFSDIELALERIDKIVAGLRDFSHLAEPQLATVDLAEVVETALRTQGERTRARGLAHRFTHRRSRVRADRHQILQVLVNLLDNARQAVGVDGEVVVETRSDEHTFDVAVIDRGPGIAPEILDRIFDPFFTTRHGGTGLGLAVVSRILGRHPCWHSVESTPGEGTRFVLTFPLEAA